jgi:hypothetical protein
MKARQIIYSFAIILAIAISCNKEDKEGTQNSDYISAADCTGSTPTYTADVQPIFDTRCAYSGCHAGNNAAHGLNLSGYDNAKNNFNDHNTLCAINHDGSCDPMPQGSAKLSDDQIKIITCWAKNNFPQ